jgi:hypothetical protein
VRHLAVEQNLIKFYFCRTESEATRLSLGFAPKKCLRCDKEQNLWNPEEHSAMRQIQREFRIPSESGRRTMCSARMRIPHKSISG